MIRKLFCVLSAALLLCVCLGACAKQEEPSQTDALVTETSSAEKTESTQAEETTAKEEESASKEIKGNLNLLTGHYDLSDEAVGKRPVVITVNNVEASMPQYGIETADIIFEIPVETGLTRMLAVYADLYAIPNVCSVRSYRYYFAPVALTYDAIYIHWGEDPSMLDYLYSLNMTRYDGISDTWLFGRDEERLAQRYNVEHTSVFYGPLLAQRLESDGARTDLDEAHNVTAFNFVPDGQEIIPDGQDCTAVDIEYGSVGSGLCYLENEGKYYKTQNGKEQIEGSNGNVLKFDNIFLLNTDIALRNVEQRISVNWNGGEGYTGYYISKGKAQPITWSKADEWSPFIFLDAQGNILNVNTGKSYITFVKESMYTLGS